MKVLFYFFFSEYYIEFHRFRIGLSGNVINRNRKVVKNNFHPKQFSEQPVALILMLSPFELILMLSSFEIILIFPVITVNVLHD